MPKTLSDGKILVTALTEKPADMNAITVAELEAGQKISCRILKSDFALGPTGSSTITETELCKMGEGQAYGLSAGAGTVTVFRYLDADGKPEGEEDFAWELFKQKGTQLWLVRRDGPVESKAWEAGDEYSAFEVTTDDPQYPTDTGGYIKRTVNLAVADMALDKVVAG